MDARAMEYARAHRRFLQQERPDVYKALLADKGEGGLTSYLSSVGSQAAEMYEHLLAGKNNDPQVQNLPYHEKVARLQAHRHEANEVVLHDLVHQPLAA